MKKFDPRIGKHPRHGVVSAESALVSVVLVVFILAFVELGLGVARSNSLSDCARQAARYTALHGSDSNAPLGTETWIGNLSDNHPIAAAIRNRLLAMSPSDVNITVEWPDGSNEVSDRVRVTLTYQPAADSRFFSGISPFRAQSAMRIMR